MYANKNIETVLSHDIHNIHNSEAQFKENARKYDPFLLISC